MKYKFEGESAPNTENKCLCVFVVDVSGTMAKYLDEINNSMKKFFFDIERGRNGVPSSTIDQLEVAVLPFDEDVLFSRNPKLLEMGELPPLFTTRNSITRSVAALSEAVSMVESRKTFYKQTAQPYYRPWIIFITDGEPNPYDEIEISRFEQQVKQDSAQKKYNILGLGVGNAISEKTLSRLTAGNARALKGSNFGGFFDWLSASIGSIVLSNPNDNIKINTNDPRWVEPY